MKRNKKIVIIALFVLFISYLSLVILSPCFIDLQTGDFISIDPTPDPKILYNNRFNFQPACFLVGGEIENKLVGIGVEASFCKITNRFVCFLRGGKYSTKEYIHYSTKSCIKELSYGIY